MLPGWRLSLTSHQPPVRSFQTLMTEQLSLMFYFYRILISREPGPSPSPLFLFPALRDLASSWSDRDTAEEIAGPVRQKTHNQYVWVWSPQIWFLPISLSLLFLLRRALFPYFWFMIIKKQLMFVINIMQMDWGMRGRSITMMDDWCWQLQLKTGIFITFNNGRCFVPAPTLSSLHHRRCRG